MIDIARALKVSPERARRPITTLITASLGGDHTPTEAVSGGRWFQNFNISLPNSMLPMEIFGTRFMVIGYQKNFQIGRASSETEVNDVAVRSETIMQFDRPLFEKRTPRTKHCVTRMQQRSIPPAVIDLLLDYGCGVPVVGGAEKYAFTKKSWRDACAYLGAQAKHFEQFRNAYVVVAASGNVLTAAYQH